MKQLFIFLSLAALLGTNLAAQSTRMEAKIPFNFQVGNTVLASGLYDVTARPDGLIWINGKDGAASVATVTFGKDRPTSDPVKGRLVFVSYGDRYFLQAVQQPGTRTARFLSKSKAELALAKDFEKQEVIVASAR